jgi:two-component system sensor histidine kinase QseC
MKLLNRTIFILVTTMLFIFLGGSMGFYFMLKSTAEKELNAELHATLRSVLEAVGEDPSSFSEFQIPGHISVKRVEADVSSSPVMQDTVLYTESDGMYRRFRMLHSVVEHGGDHLRVQVYKSMIASDELIERILLIAISIILLYIVFLYLINRVMFERIWSDFFKTVHALESYDVNSEEQLNFTESEIMEFNLLNQTLNQMMRRIRADYENVKEFTGNVSHEIQTPLSVIRMKCELLLQTAPLSEEQATLIRDIQRSNSGLSRLNRTLVLLTKIENHQFTHLEAVSIPARLRHHLDEFSSLFELKDIRFSLEEEGDFHLQADPMLIDVLLVNLVKNAIDHNQKGGQVQVKISRNQLLIANSSATGDLSDEPIFNRYKQVNRKAGTFGLGLSLVKLITDLYHMQIAYEFKQGLHQFTLKK